MKKRPKSTKGWIKGQSSAELAIFGSLLLILFSTILTYGQRFDFRQQVKMEAFRRALQEAYYRNASVSYTYKRHSRLMDLFSGFGQGQAKDAQSSASVMWVKGMPGIQGDEDQVMHRSFSLYNVNEHMLDLPKYPKEIITRTGEEQTSWIPVGVYAEDTARRTKYKGTMKREESEEEIETMKGSELEDELNITFHTRYDTSVSDERDNPIDRYAAYIYEDDYWEYEDYSGYIAGGFEVD
ncbi:MAG: hypothetical protein JSW17_03480, partial [Candidatus Omnitrophota bacterium]